MFCTLRKYFLERSVDIILKASIPKLREKLLEALQAVLPIVAIVLVLCFSIAPVSPSILLCFLLGAAMIIVGIMFFTLGAEMSMSPMGERVGAMLTKSRSVPLIIGVGFLLGFLIIASSPDYSPLAQKLMLSDTDSQSHTAENGADRLPVSAAVFSLLCHITPYRYSCRPHCRKMPSV